MEKGLEGVSSTMASGEPVVFTKRSQARALSQQKESSRSTPELVTIITPGVWSHGGYGAGRYPPPATLRHCQSSNALHGQKIIRQLDRWQRFRAAGAAGLHPRAFRSGHGSAGLLAITFWGWEEQQSQAVPEAVLVWVCRAQATGTARVVHTHLGQDGAGLSTKSLWQMRKGTRKSTKSSGNKFSRAM